VFLQRVVRLRETLGLSGKWRDVMGRRKNVESRTMTWVHLAAAAQIIGPLHAVGPSVPAAAARWRQSQGLGFRRFSTPYWLGRRR